MPVYFFHIEGDGEPDYDKEGTVLTGLEEARAMAVRVAGGLLQDAEGGFWDSGQWRLWVADDQGAEVCALTIRGHPCD